MAEVVSGEKQTQAAVRAHLRDRRGSTWDKFDRMVLRQAVLQSIATLRTAGSLVPRSTVSTARLRRSVRTPTAPGVIAVGVDADIVAVSGNPLDDIRCLQTICAVIVAGSRVNLTQGRKCDARQASWCPPYQLS